MLWVASFQLSREIVEIDGAAFSMLLQHSFVGWPPSRSVLPLFHISHILNHIVASHKKALGWEIIVCS